MGGQFWDSVSIFSKPQREDLACSNGIEVRILFSLFAVTEARWLLSHRKAFLAVPKLEDEARMPA